MKKLTVILGKLTLLYPIVFIVVLFFILRGLILQPSLGNLLSLIGWVYIVPVILYHIYKLILPFEKGKFILSPNDPKGFGWFVSLRIQSIYEIFPIFEKLLRIIPPIYNLWLWSFGSRVHLSVLWNGNVSVYDRGDLNIGKNVVIGSEVVISNHVVNPSRQGVSIIYQPVTIEKEVFIGAKTYIGPGVHLTEKQFIPFNSVYYGDRKLTILELEKLVAKFKTE